MARQVCAAAGTAVSSNGARCECAAGSYNASAAGALLCVGAGWLPSLARNRGLEL